MSALELLGRFQTRKPRIEPQGRAGLPKAPQVTEISSQRNGRIPAKRVSRYRVIEISDDDADENLDGRHKKKKVPIYVSSDDEQNSQIRPSLSEPRNTVSPVQNFRTRAQAALANQRDLSHRSNGTTSAKTTDEDCDRSATTIPFGLATPPARVDDQIVYDTPKSKRKRRNELFENSLTPPYSGRSRQSHRPKALLLQPSVKRPVIPEFRKTSGTKTASISAPPPPAVAPSKSVEEELEMRKNAFLWHYQFKFSSLLPAENTFFSRLAELHISESLVPFEHLSRQPRGVKAQLKDYQLIGLSFLVWLYRNGASGILGDEMGLGKTVQTLSLLQYLKECERKPSLTSLVICPLSVLGTWMLEAKKFTPELKVLQLHGSPSARQSIKTLFRRTRKQGQLEAQYDLVVTTYETVVADSHFFTRNNRWAFTILDEGHKIKNHTAQVSTTVARIKDQFKLVLSGTPLQNNLVELWSILNILYPKVFTQDSVEAFDNAFNLRRGQVDSQTLSNARKLLDVVMLRRTKNSPGLNLNLPPKQVIYLRVPLAPSQREQYLSILTNAQEIVQNSWHLASDPSGSTQKKLLLQPAQRPVWIRLKNMVLKLRQICSHPSLCREDWTRDSNSKQGIIQSSSKFMVLEKLIHELAVERQNKIIIFSEWLEILDLVEQVLGSYSDIDTSFKHLRLDGGTPSAKRNLVIRLFQDFESEYRVILISTTAGGLGITLTAASSVIFLDENWNPQITLQAEGRAHRLGQLKPVTIYKVYTAGTVEEQMLGRIRKKLYLSHKITESTTNINIRHRASNDYSSSDLDEQDTDEDAVEMNLFQLRNLIRRGSRLLDSQQFDATEIGSWTFEQLIQNCRDDQVDQMQDDIDEPFDAEEEQRWLSVTERVSCANFEGTKIERTKTQNFLDQVDMGLERKDRRVGKNRTVTVNDFPVLKESLRCGEWEAVSTTTANQSLPAKRNRSSCAWEHETHCHKCRGLADLIKCRSCPRAFHQSCTTNFVPKTAFRCAQHKCTVCELGPVDVGGMLYKCRGCEKAFCETHLDFDSIELLGEKLPELEVCGYGAKENAWYIQCGECKRGNVPPEFENNQTTSHPSSPLSELSDADVESES